ncbi:MAG: DUF4197 domain-containing protein [Bacteroidota bacterium]|jgi:hypothetical protein
MEFSAKYLAVTVATATTIIMQSCGNINVAQLENVAKQASQITASQPAIPALTQDEAANGLKEALKQGVSAGVSALNTAGAFYQNPMRMIPLPPEVKNVEQKIRNNALLNAAIGKELDKAIEAMNRGAENAMVKASPIFVNAITSMSFADAMKILTGGNGAATSYLSNTTKSQLTTAFKPEVKQALDAVSITNYWKPIIATINKNKLLLGLSADINPDLEAYVTDLATSALFVEITQRENNLRSSLTNRNTDLLKKVFSYADSNSSNK